MSAKPIPPSESDLEASVRILKIKALPARHEDIVYGVMVARAKKTRQAVHLQDMVSKSGLRNMQVRWALSKLLDKGRAFHANTEKSGFYVPNMRK